MTDEAIHESYTGLKRVKWRDYGGRDAGFQWYYAEKRLYVIRCKATGLLYMTHAGSPDQAMETCREAMKMYLAAMADELAPPPPVRRGKWLHTGTPKSSQFTCSECGRTVYWPQANRSRDGVLRMPYGHCPFCVAEMEVEHEN